MTVKELRDKETNHLNEELVEKRKHLFNLRSQAVTEKLEDPSQLRKTRKEIAQMRTILRQREIAAQPKPAKAPAEKKVPAKKAATKKKPSMKKKPIAKEMATAAAK